MIKKIYEENNYKRSDNWRVNFRKLKFLFIIKSSNTNYLLCNDNRILMISISHLKVITNYFINLNDIILKVIFNIN